ncbi:hypothetical protein L0Y46_03165 [bacterium]|nr:hypothetical protein [bacterium]
MKKKVLKAFWKSIGCALLAVLLLSPFVVFIQDEYARSGPESAVALRLSYGFSLSLFDSIREFKKVAHAAFSDRLADIETKREEKMKEREERMAERMERHGIKAQDDSEEVTDAPLADSIEDLYNPPSLYEEPSFISMRDDINGTEEGGGEADFSPSPEQTAPVYPETDSIDPDPIIFQDETIERSSESSLTEEESAAPEAATEVEPAKVELSESSLPRDIKWGAYGGWSAASAQAFADLSGANPDHVAIFVHWGNDGGVFPSHLNSVAKDAGRTLLIFWEASDYTISSPEQPAYSYDAILRGDWDGYIKSFADAARSYGDPIILVPFSEMNYNGVAWSGVKNGNTPSKAVRGYRHVRNVFGDLPNVRFGWAPNHESVPDTYENRIEAYYPGDGYVDIVGLDGFNFGNSWRPFAELFAEPLDLISGYGKPIYIFSFASAEGTGKAAWITDALVNQIPKYPLIEGWNWFHQDKERNWRIDSDPESLAAFRAAVAEL